VYSHYVLVPKKKLLNGSPLYHRVSFFPTSIQLKPLFLTLVSLGCVAVARQKALAQTKRAAAPRTPRTPGVLKGFWRGRIPETETMRYPYTTFFLAGGSVLNRLCMLICSWCFYSTLRTQFFQLNFSVASLSRPDFFQRLMNDFPNDSTIMQCLYDIILNPIDG
jgi:hypothetical protein